MNFLLNSSFYLIICFFSIKKKTTFEDVFPAEATTVEEYLQQVSFPFLLAAIIVPNVYERNNISVLLKWKNLKLKN